MNLNSLKAFSEWTLHEKYSLNFRTNIIKETSSASQTSRGIYVLCQGGLNITQYFINLKKLWKELENLKIIPSCTCNSKCTCSLLPTIKEYCEGDYVIRFLKGLKEQYAKLWSQIILMTPLPHINKVFSMLIQQEWSLLYST